MLTRLLFPNEVVILNSQLGRSNIQSLQPAADRRRQLIFTLECLNFSSNIPSQPVGVVIMESEAAHPLVSLLLGVLVEAGVVTVIGVAVEVIAPVHHF